MKISLSILIAVLALGVGVANGQIMPRYGQADMEDFLNPPIATTPQLSPNGQFVAFTVHNPNGSNGDILIIDDLDSGSDQSSQQASFGDFPIVGLNWASDTHLLVTLSLDQEVAITGFGLRGVSFNAPVIRTLSFDRRDLTRPVVLFENEGRQVFTNFFNAAGNRLVNVLPEDDQHVLMSAYRRDTLHLWRVNILTGDADIVEQGNNRTTHWHTDAAGNAVMRIDIGSQGRSVRFYVREPGGRRWRRIRTYRTNELTDREAEFDWAGFSETAGQIYVFSQREAQDLRGLYLYDIASEAYISTIIEHERVDITNALIRPQSGELLGYAYLDDRLEVEFIDPEFRAHFDGIRSFFGDEVNILPADFAGDRMVLFVSGPRDSGTYYLYDRVNRSLDPLMSLRPRLPPDVLHDVEIVRYPTSDGLTLTAYLTQPRHGMGPDTPLILMPHGGPEARDRYDFDLLAQYYASQGYAVLQPNFRGSSGYGQRFAESGYRQWGERMQLDLDEGVEHLISQGRVAADRICIAGFSYGGYAALMGGATRPDLYQCVFAGAAVTDLIAFVDQWEDRNEDAHAYWTEAIGDTQADQERLTRVSPVNLASQMTMPVLLVHSQDDPIVPFEQSTEMADALDAAGATYDFQTYSNAGHSFGSVGQLRSIMIRTTELFDRTIGPERGLHEDVFTSELFSPGRFVRPSSGTSSQGDNDEVKDGTASDQVE